MSHTLTANFLHQFHTHLESYKNVTEFGNRRRFQKNLGCWKCQLSTLALVSEQFLYSRQKCHVHKEDKACVTTKSDLYLRVQTLRKLPIEKLSGKVVIVRFDSALLLEQLSINSVSINKALSTIRYLHSAGARVLLVSNWDQSSDPEHLSPRSFADYLSSLLCLQVMPANDISGPMQSHTKQFEEADIFLLDNLTKFREELANCSSFSGKLSSGAYIFVNDAFSLSHKILASTVGITRYCHASVAGFHFEGELLHLEDARKTTRSPYIAIVGGSKFLEKVNALRHLVSICDGLIFVGMLGFQIMHAMGLPVPSRFLENGAAKEAEKLIQLSQSRSLPMYFPEDFWCYNDCNQTSLELFPSDGIMDGWTPVDIGPLSMKEIFSLLSKCKKILWIGPVKFGFSVRNTNGALELASILERISQAGCDVTVVGNAACKAVAEKASPLATYKIFKSASVVWEFLKGKTLPGVAALDRAYPFDLVWDIMFSEPRKPLVVDVGSGSGLFLLKMAKRWKNSNFLGLEVNNKLVRRCLDSIAESGIRNGYFITTNATSTFRSIVSSYPGDLILVSIQCPNPDFNKEMNRWRLVQRTLIEAIIDLLKPNGEVFLQSDIESVATRMKEQFITYGKGKLVSHGDDVQGWIPENPFHVHSDWEQHVLDRGDPMYRVLLRKVSDQQSSS